MMNGLYRVFSQARRNEVAERERARARARDADAGCSKKRVYTAAASATPSALLPTLPARSAALPLAVPRFLLVVSDKALRDAGTEQLSLVRCVLLWTRTSRRICRPDPHSVIVARTGKDRAVARAP